MATLYTDNYQKQWVDKPNKPFNKGEVAGRARVLVGRLSGQTLADINSGDEVLIGFIPANSVILDAYIKIDKSLGATGILTLGHGATTNEDFDGSEVAIAADDDGLVGAADGGGQAALTRVGISSAIIGQRLGSETLIKAVCTEDADGTVTDAEALFVIVYAND